MKTFKLSGLEVNSLNADDFIKLPDVFTQQTIPVNHQNIPNQEDLNQ